MRAAAIICFVLAGLMALGSLRSVVSPPHPGPNAEAFWIGYYTALIMGPLVPLALGLGLRRAARRRERTQADSGAGHAPPAPRQKWSAAYRCLTALFLLGTIMAFPPKGEDWPALNVAGVLIGTCLTLGAAYMAVRPKGSGPEAG